MEINVREGSRIVEIWLTKAEKQDAAIQEKLKPMYRAYKDKNYLVAVFQSGGRDLADAASDLLCYNRKRIAQLAVEREKQRGAGPGMQALLTENEPRAGNSADDDSRLARVYSGDWDK